MTPALKGVQDRDINELRERLFPEFSEFSARAGNARPYRLRYTAVRRGGYQPPTCKGRNNGCRGGVSPPAWFFGRGDPSPTVFHKTQKYFLSL